MADASRPRIAIVGGGLAGLVAAFRLGEEATRTGRPVEIVIFEAGARLGGAVETVERNGYLIERGADSFLTKPEMLALCRTLDLESELLPTDPQYRGALVLHKGRPVSVPLGFSLMSPSRLWPILSTPLLDLSGKLRLLREPFIPPRREQTDESLASFATRRLGQQAFDRLVQPLISGIYTADPEKLSLAATLPRFPEMERRYGSLLRATLFRKNRELGDGNGTGARYGLFAGFSGGMEQLLSALSTKVANFAEVRVNTPVESVTQIINEAYGGPAWRVEGTAHAEGEAFDALVLALPAYKASGLIRGWDASLADSLMGIPYASSAVVASGYCLADIQHPLNAFGLVIPTVEQRSILAVSFASRKFPGRVPDGRVLLRTFVGGATRPDQFGWSDEQLIKTVRRELHELLGVQGEPEVELVSRFGRAMPQYHVGHLDLVARIEEQTGQHRNLALTGSAYRGVGMPDVIAHANRCAETIFHGLVGGSPAGKTVSPPVV